MQALMDLGSEICRKKSVNCLICPIKKYCHFYNEKKEINFDALKDKKRKFLFVYLIKYKNQIILKKRKKTKFLHGLMEIPNNLLNNKPSLKVAKQNAPLNLDWKTLPGKLNSKISNFELEIRFFQAQVEKKITLKKTKIAKGSTKRRCPNISKIKKLGFKPRVNLNNGLKETYEWYLEDSRNAL